MENNDWKKLWNENYRGENDTKELKDFIKKLNYGSRVDVSYLPWAVVERIFKLQDGEVEILRADNGHGEISDENTIVEIDKTITRYDITENGIAVPKYMLSYFINAKATWQGRTYVEHYPLQDSTGKPMTYWTQNDLNKASQRAKVKAIAIVSGIGYKLFEDGDLQFVDDETKAAKEALEKEIAEKSEKEKVANEKAAKEKAAKEKAAKEKAEKEKAEKESKPENTAVEQTISNAGALSSSDKSVEEPLKEVDVAQVVEEPKIVPTQTQLSRVEIDNAIKNIFLTGSSDKTQKIKDYLKNVNTKKVADLSDTQATELYNLVK